MINEYLIKSSQNLAPEYLSCQAVRRIAYFNICAGCMLKNLRTYGLDLGQQLLVVPRYQLSSYGRQAFCVAGPSVWNSLPDSLWNPINYWREQFQTISEDVSVRNVLMH